MNLFAKIALPAVAALLSTAAVEAQSRTLVLLQQSDSMEVLTDWIPGAFPSFSSGQIIQEIANTTILPFRVAGEAANFSGLAAAKYQRFVNLSNLACTRANLLTTLINESVAGNTVDLAVICRGSAERLEMNSGAALSGATRSSSGLILSTGTIRSLLTEARATRGAGFNFTLRLVHMTGNFGSTLNDDWLAIGAKTSVGPRARNWMPQPATRWFFDAFAKSDQRVGPAAADTHSASIPVWAALAGTYVQVDAATGLSKYDESVQIVAGNANLIFRDEALLAVGQTKTVTLSAATESRGVSAFLMPGQTYRISASGTWKNGGVSAGPGGYAPGLFDGFRRHPSNMLNLIGERSARFGGAALSNSAFEIGLSRDIAPSSFGFLLLWANDMFGGYGDNSGSITVTIRRLS